MVDQVTFRTTDNTRWGAGLGSDLPAATIDINFWVLLTAVQALQSSADQAAGISTIIITGDQMFIHLTNHFVLGPFTLPTAEWNFRGEWAPSVGYAAFDVITHQRAIYLVLLSHVSNSLFSAGANDGHGHNFYALLLAAAPPELPQTGTEGAFLQWQSSPGDVRWFPFPRNIALFIEGTPNPLEWIVEYATPEDVDLPQGLVGSQFSIGTPPTGDQQYELFQDGGNIGNVTFHANGTHTVVFNHPITLSKGDIFSVQAPTIPDPHMSRIRMTFAGTLS